MPVFMWEALLKALKVPGMFRQGNTINVLAYIFKDIISNFKLVPKCYNSILYTVKNLDEMIFKPRIPKNSLFHVRSKPKYF